ncbi:MAG: dihydroorotase [bacterium]
MSHESILIQQANFFQNQHMVQGDILIKDHKILKIAPSLAKHAEHIIPAQHFFLMPGVIDPHVHFRDPGLCHKEDLESGSKAAAAGGVTSFFDMPNTLPNTDTCEHMAEKKAIAAQKSLINYNFFMAATHDNLSELIRAENIAGIKIYVGSSTGNLLVNQPEILENIFAQSNKLIAVHSEDETTIIANQNKYLPNDDPKTHLKIRSKEAAITCTNMLLKLAKTHQSRLHICHLTTAEEAQLIQKAQLSNVSCEATVQHLHLDDSLYDQIGPFAQLNPPIRDKANAQALQNALKTGIINCLASDHSPHTKKEKSQRFGKAPSGIPSVETQLPVMLNQVQKKNYTLQQLQQWFCHAPAQLFNIHNKGFLKEGYDADLTLIDLKKSKILQENHLYCKAKWSPYSGQKLTGWPLITLVNGHIVFQEGDFFDEIKGKEIYISQKSH